MNLAITRADDRAPLEVCRSLAPTELPRYRDTRYAGDSLQTCLADYPAADRAALRELYERLTATWGSLAALIGSARHSAAIDEAGFSEQFADEVHAVASRLGMQDTGYSPVARRALHDIRGGALATLLMDFEMVRDELIWERDVLLRMFRYVRDHLKIMRNCIPDIDPARSRADQSAVAHSIDLLKEKWLGVALSGMGRDVTINLTCDWHGTICESCMEMSALDRIVYNLIGNAVKYGDGDWIQLRVFPVGNGSGDIDVLRFVAANPISAAQEAALNRAFDGDLNRIFEANQTTQGSGYGLAIILEFVAQAFGLDSTGDALQQAHVGARIIDRHFYTWFHWPSVV